MAEKYALMLAKLEIDYLPLWGYYYDVREQHNGNSTKAPPTRRGATFGITKDDSNKISYHLLSNYKTKGIDKATIEVSFLDFLWEMQQQVSSYIGNIEVYAEIQKNGATYRGSPMYHGDVWRDWVMVNWEGYGLLPNRVWGFVDLTGLPEDNNVRCGDIDTIPPGRYAIVESTKKDEDGNDEPSELFTPYLLDVGRMSPDNRVVKLRFYLADVESFHEPAVVVPDIGGPANRYFLMKSRSKWAEAFGKWLERDYEDIDDLEDDKVMEEEGEDEEEDDLDNSDSE